MVDIFVEDQYMIDKALFDDEQESTTDIKRTYYCE